MVIREIENNKKMYIFALLMLFMGLCMQNAKKDWLLDTEQNCILTIDGFFGYNIMRWAFGAFEYFISIHILSILKDCPKSSWFWILELPIGVVPTGKVWVLISPIQRAYSSKFI